MIKARFFRLCILTLFASIISVTVFGQAEPAKKDFEPVAYQAGKDVVLR